MKQPGMNPDEFLNIASAEQDLWWYRGQRDILTSLIERRKKEFAPVRRVLEGGCGTGHMSAFLAERYGWEVTPLDVSATGLAHARRRGRVQLIQGDITRLPVSNDSFDAVVSLDVINHLGRGLELTAFKEFLRVLRPGGILLLRTVAFDALRSRHSTFILERQRFTRSKLEGALRTAGFQLLFCTYVNALLSPVAWFKFRIWEPLTAAPPKSGVLPVAPWLNRALLLPLQAEARWIGMGGSFPVGQSLLILAVKGERE